MLLMVALMLSATAQAQESWDLEKCRQSLAEGKAEAGHVCTPEHLQADLALLRKAPNPWAFTPQQEHDIAERGDAVAVARGQEAFESMAEKQKEEEKRVAALDPKLKGAGLLKECELYLRLMAIMSGTEAAPLGTSQELANINYSAGACEGYILGVVDSLDANWACPNFLVKPIALGHPVLCAPEGVTYIQIIRVVVKYLGDHPERLHKLRYELVADALKSTFPCPKQ